jgi:transcriptional regulator with GAF, ATPase, and Fis domain
MEALHMRPKSLKQTLLLTVAILVIISGILISQVVTHRYSVGLLEGAVAQAEKIAHKLALDAADKVLINDIVALQKLLDDQLFSNPAVGYLFVVQDNQVITHTFPAGVPSELIMANLSNDSEKGHLEKIVSDGGEHYLDIAWPIFNGKAGTLRLGFSETPYRLRVTQLWLQMSLITLGILVISLAASYLFIKRLTRPLLSLTHAATKIHEGNLDTEIIVEGRAEVTQLASSFKGMLARLKDYTDKIEKTNKKLEGKNLELDRAHQQLRTSFTISQEIGALATLKDVCTYLIRTFKNIVECQHMAILVFSSSKKESFLVSESDYEILRNKEYDATCAAIKGLETINFIQNIERSSVPLPDNMQFAKRLAVLPLHHQNEHLGAMLIACPGKCLCVTKELDVLDLILKQTSGAIKRSSKHEEEIHDLRTRVETTSVFSGLVGKNPQMHVIYKLIEDVAPTDATVLIQGESGTGKELVARAIHRNSIRKDKAFVVINCSAYPSTLLESELFGHEKGAFTGAVRRKPGRFEQADGGTVFLDEIGEINASAQIKLLRVLQSQRFERLGGEQKLTVDIRILAATNKNLLDEVKNSGFREDLFYRLNVIPINLPPLRERRNDIPLLSQHFLDRFCEEQNKKIKAFSSEAMRMLLEYSWPGNVRELENTIEHAVVLAKEDVIQVSDIPKGLRDEHISAPAKPNKTILENEKKLLQDVLEECGWNKKEAAQRLGISRSALYGKLRRYKIVNPTIH